MVLVQNLADLWIPVADNSIGEAFLVQRDDKWITLQLLHMTLNAYTSQQIVLPPPQNEYLAHSHYQPLQY